MIPMSDRATLLRLFGVAAMVAMTLLAETPAGTPQVDFASVRRSERMIDSRIERYSASTPMEVIGATRAIYLGGTGLIFSIEVSLVPVVGISPFFAGTSLPVSEVEKIRVAKLQRIPVLRELLLTMLPEMAKVHADVPDGEEIVMGATLFYVPYENREGLPAQIVVRAPAGALRKVHTQGDVSDAARVTPLAKVTLY